MTFSTKEIKKENLVYLDNLHKREEGRGDETRRDATRRGQTRRDEATANMVDGAAYFRFQWPIILANYPCVSQPTCVACP